MDLKEYLFRNKMTHMEMGHLLGYHHRYIGSIARGDIWPGKKFVKVLFEITDGIVDMREKTKS